MFYSIEKHPLLEIQLKGTQIILIALGGGLLMPFVGKKFHASSVIYCVIDSTRCKNKKKPCYVTFNIVDMTLLKKTHQQLTLHCF